MIWPAVFPASGIWRADFETIPAREKEGRILGKAKYVNPI